MMRGRPIHTRTVQAILASDLPVRVLAKRYQVSVATVCRLRKKIAVRS